MGACSICGRRAAPVSEALGVCIECVRREPASALAIAQAAHSLARRGFGLPPEPPRAAGGVPCPLCGRECSMGDGERGFCGMRTAHDGRLVHLAGAAAAGLLQWYRDPLPTNCVADWVCAGSKQAGCHNLAVFYASCTLDCLFCQNWHFREAAPERSRLVSAAALTRAANPRTFCVCFFGGDPASQMPHALAAGRRLAAAGVRVCWETAGTSNPKLLDRALDLSLRTGGCIKFDLKAFDEALHTVLTGASNCRTLENFARAAKRFAERPDPPLLVASTLLIPGYVDAEEVHRVARFIAALNPEIPYALLGFTPHFLMTDLPPTSLRHAQEAESAARSAGLKNVRIGNRHLLSHEY